MHAQVPVAAFDDDDGLAAKTDSKDLLLCVCCLQAANCPGGAPHG